jgi:hypothetical protein
MISVGFDAVPLCSVGHRQVECELADEPTVVGACARDPSSVCSDVTTLRRLVLLDCRVSSADAMHEHRERLSVAVNSTSTLAASSTPVGIPQREQVLIDAFNSYIQIGIGSLLFLFGLTFNCLSLLYFRVSRSFRHTTFQLYFSIISILDTIRLLEFLVFVLFDKGYLKVTLMLCRSIFFTIMFTGQVSRSTRVDPSLGDTTEVTRLLDSFRLVEFNRSCRERSARARTRTILVASRRSQSPSGRTLDSIG